jgi:hypothetical protein
LKLFKIFFRALLLNSSGAQRLFDHPVLLLYVRRIFVTKRRHEIKLRAAEINFLTATKACAKLAKTEMTTAEM